MIYCINDIFFCAISDAHFAKILLPISTQIAILVFALFPEPVELANSLSFHTDFIFSSIGEEFGFIGCAVAIGLLFVIIFKCLHIAKRSRTSVGKYMCVGVAAMFIFHVWENVAMCMGLMPVTGIPLPFFSYGGSSMLTNLVAIGLVMNVWSRRNTATL